jgi:hypothetical protein
MKTTIECKEIADAKQGLIISPPQLDSLISSPRPDSIPALVALLKDGTTGEEKKAVAEALGMIAYNNNQMREAVAQAGAIPALVALLKDGTTGEEKRTAADALGRIAMGSDQRREAVALAGAIPALVALLKDGITGEEKEAAAWALHQLSYHRSIKDQIRPSLAIVQAADRRGVVSAKNILTVIMT